MHVAYHPEAETELEAAALYLENEVEGLGDRFLDEYLRTLALIQQHPATYRKIFRDVRKLNLRDFRYGVLYRFNGYSLLIVAVMHLAREPDYWKRRLT